MLPGSRLPLAQKPRGRGAVSASGVQALAGAEAWAEALRKSAGSGFGSDLRLRSVAKVLPFPECYRNEVSQDAARLASFT